MEVNLHTMANLAQGISKDKLCTYKIQPLNVLRNWYPCLEHLKKYNYWGGNCILDRQEKGNRMRAQEKLYLNLTQHSKKYKDIDFELQKI